MSIRPETVALLDRFLSAERTAETTLYEIRDLLCDVIWAGDALHEETELIEKHAPKGFAPDLPSVRADWREVGGQAALDRLDVLTANLLDILEAS